MKEILNRQGRREKGSNSYSEDKEDEIKNKFSQKDEYSFPNKANKIYPC